MNPPFMCIMPKLPFIHYKSPNLILASDLRVNETH